MSISKLQVPNREVMGPLANTIKQNKSLGGGFPACPALLWLNVDSYNIDTRSTRASQERWCTTNELRPRQIQENKKKVNFDQTRSYSSGRLILDRLALLKCE